MSLHVPQPPTRSRTRDLVAVLLMLVGGTGLAVAAFAWDVRAGAAVVSLYVLTVGVVLSVDRTPTANAPEVIAGGELHL